MGTPSLEDPSVTKVRPMEALAQAPILVVEDERDLAEEIRSELQAGGHPVTLSETVEDALNAARAGGASVLVVDRMLHGEDGLSIIETLRSEGNATPVLVISALSSVDERINGLKAGGDDYLVKPFDIRELTARVDALLRRRGDSRVTRLQAGDLDMDLVERKVRCAGRPVDLLPREFKLLEYFMRRPGQIVDSSDAARGCVEFQIPGADQRRRRPDRQSASQARPDRRATVHRQRQGGRVQTEC